MLAQTLHRRSAPDLREEGRPVDQRAVGIGVEEVLRQVAVEPLHIGLVDRPDELTVEVPQGREMPRVAVRHILPPSDSMNARKIGARGAGRIRFRRISRF